MSDTNIKFYRVSTLPESGFVVGGVYFVTSESKIYVRTAYGWEAYAGSDSGSGSSSGTSMQSITYSELKTLRDNSQLTPGQSYRITDFVTTTVQSETRSAGHAFDVIVVADSENTLNENARACLHDGDTYFADSNLEAWQLKYCLDNDTTRFGWADTTNGKGVIYRMIDEWNNDYPYDFKNIQYKRYKCSDVVGPFDEKYVGCKHDNTIYPYGSRFSSSTTDFQWCYTFNDNANVVDDEYSDASLTGSDYNNTMAGDVKSLPNVVMGTTCYNTTCGQGCYGWTCCDSCHDWACGTDCYLWACAYNVRFWTCGCKCYQWVCDTNCYLWSCGNYCYKWTSSEKCYNWTCRNYCYDWYAGSGSHSWTCGNYCIAWVTGSWSGSTATAQNYVQYFNLASGTSYIGIKSSGSPTSSAPLKNIVFKGGIMGSYSSRLNIVINTSNFPLNSNYEWIIAKNSSGTIKQYCEADLIS